MELFKWNSLISVDIEEIDDQHKKLIKMINDLYTAMKAKKSQDIVSELLYQLLEYTKTHFAVEERYFIKFGYAEAQEHIKQHHEFIEKIRSFKSDFDDGSKLLSVGIMSFLVDWLVKHIKQVDKQYQPLFKSNGL